MPRTPPPPQLAILTGRQVKDRDRVERDVVDAAASILSIAHRVRTDQEDDEVAEQLRLPLD